METNDFLGNEIFKIIENQLSNNDPPETKLTFERLKQNGYSEQDSKKLIGQCLAVEIFNIMKNGEEFNEKRYLNNLKNLPKVPNE